MQLDFPQDSARREPRTKSSPAAFLLSESRAQTAPMRRKARAFSDHAGDAINRFSLAQPGFQ